MRKNLPDLLVTAQSITVCGAVVGVGVGLLDAASAAYVCFDSCPEPATFFANQGPDTVRGMLPFVALELLALALFVAHGVATRRSRRTLTQAAALLGVGVVSVVGLAAFMQSGHANIPIMRDGADSYFAESALETWQRDWGLALMLVAGVWSGALLAMQSVAARHQSTPLSPQRGRS